MEFVIQSNSARNIKNFSDVKSEGEYLVPTGKRFKVMKVRNPAADGVIRVFLREVR